MAELHSVKSKNADHEKSLDGGFALRMMEVLEGGHRSLVWLAKEADVSYRTLYDITRGRARLRRSTVDRLARALQVSPEWLLTGSGQAPSSTAAVREPRAEYMTASPKAPDTAITLEEAMRVIAMHLHCPVEVVEAFAFRVLHKAGGGK